LPDANLKGKRTGKKLRKKKILVKKNNKRKNYRKKIGENVLTVEI
jgi:ribosomal protein L21